MIASTAVLHPGVRLGKNVSIEDYCIIGLPVKGLEAVETVIGDDSVIRAMTIIYAGNRIGRNFQTGNKANIRESNIIGDNVSVGTLSVIEHHVTIENDVRIHSQVFVPEFSHLKSGCWLGPNVVLTNAKVPLAPDAKETLSGPVIGGHAIIGANTTILPGVVVGRHALVGAGSVVTRDVEPWVVAFGNPAIRKSKRDSSQIRPDRISDLDTEHRQ
jgi:acetyltransferase-like isoleucine patch superfamily enzyme